MNETRVTKGIIIDLFNGVVANITTSSSLGFSREELPEEWHNHNKALHISVKCWDIILSILLVDTSSALNVMPKVTLIKLNVDRTFIKSISLVVKAFDGSRRMMFREVDLPMVVGPHTFMTTFQVIDVHLDYTCLLGRPWIHVIGVVISTLH